MADLVVPRYEFLRGSPGSVLQNLTDTASFPVVAVNDQGRFVYGNQTTEGLLGYDSHQLTSKTIYDLLDAGPAWANAEFGFLQTERFWSGRVVLRQLDGSLMSFTVNAFAGARTAGGPDYIGLLHPIHDVADSGRVIPPNEPYDLNARDKCLLQLMSEGLADKEIANLLGTSVWTINKEVGKVLQKMNAPSRTRACIAAIKADLIL